MSSSLIPNLRKDLTRQLKTVFAADSPSTFPSLSPPASLLDLVEQYLSASKDASLSRSTTASASKDAQASAKEVFVEHQKLVDLLIETSIALPKTPSKLRRPGRISAWLIVLERLCTVHASDDTAADESQLVQKEQITTLWPALLRKVLLPSTGEGMHFTMGREGLAAAKSILAWSFKGKPDSGSAADLGKFESGIMAEYAALAVRPLVPQKQEDAKTKEKEIRDMQDVLCSLGHMRPKVDPLGYVELSLIYVIDLLCLFRLESTFATSKSVSAPYASGSLPPKTCQPIASYSTCSAIRSTIAVHPARARRTSGPVSCQ